MLLARCRRLRKLTGTNRAEKPFLEAPLVFEGSLDRLGHALQRL